MVQPPSIHPSTPSIWIPDVCFGVRALKIGQQCKTLHREEKKPPEKSPRGYQVWSWNMEFASTGFWVSLHLDENTAQSQTIHLMSYSIKRKKKDMPALTVIHHQSFRCTSTCRDWIQFYSRTLWCWRKGAEAHIEGGEYVALMCSELTQWWVSGDLLPAWRQSQKQSHGLKGGMALKPEIDDSWGVRVHVHECVWIPATYYMYS